MPVLPARRMLPRMLAPSSLHASPCACTSAPSRISLCRRPAARPLHCQLRRLPVCRDVCHQPGPPQNGHQGVGRRGKPMGMGQRWDQGGTGRLWTAASRHAAALAAPWSGPQPAPPASCCRSACTPQFVTMLEFYTGQNVQVNVSRLQALVSKEVSAQLSKRDAFDAQGGRLCSARLNAGWTTCCPCGRCRLHALTHALGEATALAISLHQP